MRSLFFLSAIVLLSSSCNFKYIGTPGGDHRPRFHYFEFSRKKYYKNSLYSKDNIDLLTKSKEMESNNKLIENRFTVLSSQDKIEKSRNINRQKNITNVKRYIDDYNQIDSAVIKDRKVSFFSPSDDYFDKQNYRLERPIKNIVIVQQMKKNGIIPMTDKTRKEFADYYEDNVAISDQSSKSAKKDVEFYNTNKNHNPDKLFTIQPKKIKEDSKPSISSNDFIKDEMDFDRGY